MIAEASIDRIVRGEGCDLTLSLQLHSGFRLIWPLPGYLMDDATDSWAAIIRWDNPEWRA